LAISCIFALIDFTMKAAFYSIAILWLLGISCTNVTEEATVPAQKVVDSTSLYGNRQFTLPEIQPQYADYLSEWSVWGDFTREMKTLNMQPLPVVKSRAEVLVKHTDSLLQKIPPQVFTNPIFTRLRVVTMRAKLLHQEAHRPRIDSLALQKSIDEINRAAENLMVQINEKFAKDAIDKSQADSEQRELAKQQRFSDSVFRAELRDKEGS